MPFRPRRARDAAIVAAVAALAGAALADTIRDGAASEKPSAAEPAKTPTAPETPRWLSVPPVPAPGRIAFTEVVGCRLRVVEASSGSETRVPGRVTNCEVWTPYAGGRVAYGVRGPSGTETRFRILDLTNSDRDFGEYEMTFGPMAWSPDGWTLAWCDSATSGVALSLGNRPERLDHCPRGYDRSGRTAYALGRDVFVAGRRVVSAGGHVDQLAFGLDGSLAVVVNRARVERYEEGRRVRTTRLPREAQGRSLSFSLDNCAALVTDGALVRLVDLGCFRGRRAFTTLSVDNCTSRPEDVTLRCARYPAPRVFEGSDAAWSPNGEWIAVAEPEAVVFHRVVGRYATVRWPAAAARVAWTLG